MLVLFASWFAIFAHESIRHKRKYTGAPYWHHVRGVAYLVESCNGTPEQIAAAWLHDTVEDTWVPLWLIRVLFGRVVAQLVWGLTDVSKPEDGNRAVRKALDREHISQQCSECKTIKLADVISNSLSIARHDPRFAKVYMAEINALLKVLSEGDELLYVTACNIVDDYYSCQVQ